MFYFYKTHLKNISRELRSKMTETEIRLWARVRNRQINHLLFHRQKPLGPYIVDFYCPAKKIIIEIDGGQHYEKEAMVKDIARDNFLSVVLKLRVLRFTNLDILNNIEGVLTKILEETR